MKKEEPKTFDFQSFVSLFMKKGDEEFTFKQSPVQIYPLSLANTFISPPTPIFKMDYTVLLIFQQGGGEQQVDNETYYLAPNDILFIREGHLNSIKSIDPRTEGYFVYIDFVILSRIFGDNNQLNQLTFNPKHTLDSKKTQWLIKCCELILEKESNSSYSVEVKTALLRSLLLTMAEDWSLPKTKIDRDLEITLSFKDKLFQNFKQHKDVKFYADALSISQNYLNRILKSTTNKSPKQHINEMVIYHSQILLQDSTKNISQVAYDLNFSDPSHFGRLFKQVTHTTPSDYLQSFMHDLSE